MSASEPDFRDYKKRNVDLSVWLVIDVPGGAAERIPELQDAMLSFARDWIAEDQTWRSGNGYAKDIGFAETSKLRMFVQER